ncbi:hypothetical protein C9374_005718 [Naegleria lovaniensis]|uniref:F-box domain-containing protein n=1 Tax=Naegleria lovaniensis TaxID=51637 RepID=A0AA88GMJ2_NAELO|nr:uncharacterized protein C9374_005718 [Naegleria lovaniensis]KAG2381926.1 hypothetical protein C9374_005718 [Naegleria lovaniensis]
MPKRQLLDSATQQEQLHTKRIKDHTPSVRNSMLPIPSDSIEWFEEMHNSPLSLSQKKDSSPDHLIPPEVFQNHIFRFLAGDDRTLRNCSLVSKSFFVWSTSDPVYDVCMQREFPFYTRRLKQINQYTNLYLKFNRRTKASFNINELFWALIEKANRDANSLERMIVDDGYLDFIHKLENEFENVKNTLYEASVKEDLTCFEDDGGLYAMCLVISQGKQAWEEMCQDPSKGEDLPGDESFLYPFSSYTYGLGEDGDEEPPFDLLAQGYDAFKEQSR